ncbi:acid phosphatase [Ilyomonas limi]|uniref:Acid phosphatase n=1 Tax=Ilyomonas limi TaxID=2575867 RepID=A0A4U3KU74_9BACT|nr:alkaline phosphatase family protein [Ilyomonas limi]TKK65961.1 acid phosphatase [Ilyomonas limi]
MKCRISIGFPGLFALMFFIMACNKESESPTASLPSDALQANATKTLPKPDHIVIVVEENHAYSQIIGSLNAPYINALANDPFAANFKRSHAVTHPSQPNYLDLYSGSNQGVTDDNNPANDPFTTANLGRQLIDARHTYATYSDGLPSIGYNGDSYNAYRRKHNPAANWMGTGVNQIPAATNQPFTAFPADYSTLPTVSLVIPDQNNDMHDGTINRGDSWLRNNMDGYIQWAKTHNSLFILTFDEDDKNHSNHIVTIFCGSMVKRGQYITKINHYNVLRTIENMYGLSYAGNAANATTITSCWK